MRWLHRISGNPASACRSVTEASRRLRGRPRQGRTRPAAGPEASPASWGAWRSAGRRTRSGPCGGAPAPSRPAGRRAGGDGAAALARIDFTPAMWTEPRERSALPFVRPPPELSPGLPRPVRAVGRRVHSRRATCPVPASAAQGGVAGLTGPVARRADGGSREPSSMRSGLRSGEANGRLGVGALSANRRRSRSTGR